MMRKISVLVAVAALPLAGCGAGEAPMGEPTMTSTAPGSPQATVDPTTTTRAPRPTGTVVKTADSEFGEMLFDQAGQAIYLFDKEKTSEPECYDACAEAWPPVLTKGEPRSAGKAKAGLLDTAKRADGSVQVTYNDHPLYYYAHEAPGEVECHNVNLNGGLWFVVTPKGDAAPA